MGGERERERERESAYVVVLGKLPWNYAFFFFFFFFSSYFTTKYNTSSLGEVAYDQYYSGCQY